jgi:hypothetical protein
VSRIHRFFVPDSARAAARVRRPSAKNNKGKVVNGYGQNGLTQIGHGLPLPLPVMLLTGSSSRPTPSSLLGMGAERVSRNQLSLMEEHQWTWR